MNYFLFCYLSTDFNEIKTVLKCFSYSLTPDTILMAIFELPDPKKPYIQIFIHIL